MAKETPKKWPSIFLADLTWNHPKVPVFQTPSGVQGLVTIFSENWWWCRVPLMTSPVKTRPNSSGQYFAPSHPLCAARRPPSVCPPTLPSPLPTQAWQFPRELSHVIGHILLQNYGFRLGLSWTLLGSRRSYIDNVPGVRSLLRIPQGSGVCEHVEWHRYMILI